MEDLFFALASLSTAILGLASAFAASLSARKRRRLDARLQAGHVFAHLEESPTDGAVWVLQNRSEHEVYDVHLTVPNGQFSFTSIPPAGELRVMADRSSLHTQEDRNPVMTFKDGEGRRWQVGRSGVKEQGKKKDKGDVFPSLTSAAVTTLIGVVATLLGAAITLLISWRMR
ncbi:hypothetical protein [Streptomyces lydicus]|uniref:hypothetical protein n=1 Tax=Streptomyces lydicus TaxID=47763 RepID=UPI0010132981|nr:hypothetical protein [Streptomyces lydicus]MDC7337196.1 hypothetical protein [Streptomyces lydicus]UEG93426.1 hypothetical protein LJ741_24545 [Streptomyces lydicus]